MKVFPLILMVTLSLFAVRVPPIEKLHIPHSEPTPVEQFMDRIAEIETPGGDHTTVNRFGMLGRYQFSPKAIKFLGFNVSRRQFLDDRELQDTVMVALMRYHNDYLDTYIRRYDGQVVKGIKINRAAILAGAHFAGAGGVQRFLTNPNNMTGTVDANGTSLRRYMSRFADLHLPAELLTL